jgi:hypothetical protein
LSSKWGALYALPLSKLRGFCQTHIRQRLDRHQTGLRQILDSHPNRSDFLSDSCPIFVRTLSESCPNLDRFDPRRNECSPGPNMRRIRLLRVCRW